MEISPRVQWLIQEHRSRQQLTTKKEGELTISVDEVTARVASFYEKIRGVVDWKEEHLLRKTAIERILKRRIFVGRKQEDFADRFLQELVRGGHFPNDSIPLEKVDEIQSIIDKYIAISDIYSQHSKGENLRKAEDWMWSIAAVEVEEALSFPLRERALIELMHQELDPKIELQERKNGPFLLAEEKSIQVYVAVQKALFKLDPATIGFHIIEKLYPDWKQPAPETLSHLGENLELIFHQIQKTLFHPYGEKFYKIAEKYDTPYLILNDIIAEDHEQFANLAKNPEHLESAARSAYERRHNSLGRKIGRAAFYSTLSVFISKIAVALLIEIPIERAMSGTVDYIPLGINMLIPPTLMFLLVRTAQTSSDENLERVVMEVMRITHGTESNASYTITPLKKKRSGLNIMVEGLYLLSFLVSFGAIAFALLFYLKFNIFSTLIFLMFVSLISFAGTKIRQRARELLILSEHQGFFIGLLDFFALPFIQAGKWLSGQIVRYNIFVLIMNFLIEIPFQVFVEFLEQWRKFLKEKREEIH
ncbi:MAG: hypothetical protein A2748_00985 [Candidatus Wildermuthbacteria bacterium RIFCSPHIGHO2_01_FULL_45_20]|uniref:Uncharacterized protein n=1 Tax=Candidatus Wildermuthbacteria bacterium RIFCSPHIGHO2_02_FULL_45_25 TaxID=1802450 RepID=A0A1G2R0V1_9BACT|nr:MAG: hypothetical protein A2748_00985 [Candidatus Wildermuthbacteria bacterium RIFCSPHIGHO2_01_FULL_45_20]OHA66450.1 MAG: hypothetical protein A3C04_01360 [Candidatus Wildermuthbacteria bacterium RIFCSPHIGHO2_02_FULL_45_25]